VALAVQEAAELLASETVLEKVVLENLAEGITARNIDSGQKARECGSMRQLLATKERHKWTRKRGEPIKESFEGGLATDGIAKQDGDKVEHVEGAGTPTSEAHALADRIEIALLREIPGAQHDFGEPGRNRRHLVGGSADLNW